MVASSEPTIAAYRTQRVLQALGYMHLNITSLLQESHLTWPEMEGTETRIPAQKHVAIWKHAIRQSQQPLLGLRVGEVLPMGRWDLIERIFHSNRTVEEALRGAIRYWNWVANEQVIKLYWGGDVAILEYASRLPHAPELQAVAEAELLYITKFCRHLLHSHMHWQEITLRHQAQGNRADYERRFDGLVLFNQQAYTIQFDATSLAQPLSPASPILQDQLRLRQQQRKLIAQSNQSTLRKVKQLLRLSPLCQAPETIAEQMGLPVETMQQLLQEEGQEFVSIVEQVNRNRAHQYLNDPTLPLSEAAFLLGFSDENHFERTIQQWFGIPPETLRRQSHRFPENEDFALR